MDIVNQTKCPADHLRPELTALPPRIAALPVLRGYPVPWFVAQVDGQYDFRVADAEKRVRAVREKLCWICGDRLGVHLAFVVGPMCGINRTTSEPPCHLECAEWSVKNCPFLTRPAMARREAGCPVDAVAPGHMLTRNPGVSLIWVTKRFGTFEPAGRRGDRLIEMGEPTNVGFWAQGRPATFEEVAASVESGLPALYQLAREEGRHALKSLEKMRGAFDEIVGKRFWGGDR